MKNGDPSLRIQWIFTLLFLVFTSCAKNNIETLQREFADLRFGMFLHFGIRTFTGGVWGEAN